MSKETAARQVGRLALPLAISARAADVGIAKPKHSPSALAQAGRSHGDGLARTAIAPT